MTPEPAAPTPAEREALLTELKGLQSSLSSLQGDSPLILPSVDEQAVASVVQDWTGVPVGRMVKNEIEAVLKLADTLNQRVIGQAHGLEVIAKRIQTSRAKLDNPNKPIGVFMLCGPSGVGKTETALALAESLYGGEQNVITINMSEFQEAHTVSTLKGAPPGYVGYGEGGVLTEAVRRRPYSVVLLDEVEKAHSDVHELFFQVFDKGWMEDGEGRHIDFKNTIILLTSNVGTELIANLCKDPDLMPEPEGVAKALREPLLKKFPAALLGRLVVIPYYPLSDAVLGNIVRLQLGRITKRVAEHHGIPFTYDEETVQADREPVHRGRERRAHDRRHPDQHGPAGRQPRVPRPDDGGCAAGGHQAGGGERRLRVPLRVGRVLRPAERGHTWQTLTTPGRTPRRAPTAEATGEQMTRQVTLDEALSMAILFLRQEQPEDAEKLLRGVLQIAPDHPVALHFAGVLAHRQKRYDESIALIERSLAIDPTQADWYSNLGIVLKAAGRLDDAIAAYGRAIALEPGHARAYNNLGVLQKMQGRAAEAEASYREAIRLDPEYADAYHNLGSLLSSLRRGPEAVAAFHRALVLSPAAPETRRLLALAHCSLGEPEKAVKIFDDWLREEPGHPIALHMRAACSGEGVPARAADDYIQQAFDGFAASFESKLERLAYRAPQIVAATLADAGAPASAALDVLDAGMRHRAVRTAAQAVRAPPRGGGPVGPDAGARREESRVRRAVPGRAHRATSPRTRPRSTWSSRPTRWSTSARSRRWRPRPRPRCAPAAC